ncbi:hypothetical protein [Fluviicola sp.]|uniref:hypothetical protein n=1 Tax=Fluviicola sp. TaxID=1917219 RepID=UPI003D290DE5
MDNKKDLEIEAIKRFVLKDRRPHVLALIADRNIGEGFGYLAHFTRYLDLRYFKKVPSMSTDSEIEFVLNEMKQHTSAKRCHVMSEDKSMDGTEMDLKEALSEIIGNGSGHLLILEKGKVVYYESEEMKERYVGVRMDNN